MYQMGTYIGFTWRLRFGNLCPVVMHLMSYHFVVIPLSVQQLAWYRKCSCHSDFVCFFVCLCSLCHTHTHSHLFNGPFSGTTRVSRYEKGKTNLDFTEARDSEWQWHQLGHMQVCILLQTDNHASSPPLRFFYRPDALPAAQPTASKH